VPRSRMAKAAGRSGLLDGDEGPDLVGVLVAGIELVDDGEDVVEVVEAVVDRRGAVVLDGPEIDRVGGQGPVAEGRILQELPGRDIDDRRAGSFERTTRSVAILSAENPAAEARRSPARRRAPGLSSGTVSGTSRGCLRSVRQMKSRRGR